MSVASTLEADLAAAAKKVEGAAEGAIAALEVDLSSAAGQAKLAADLAAALTKAEPLIVKLASAAGANAGTITTDLSNLISGLGKLGALASATGV